MSGQFVIREAETGDAEALSELAVLTYSVAFGHTFSEADLAAHLEKYLTPKSFRQIIGSDVVLLAFAEERMVGYAQFGPLNTEDATGSTQELRRLYVHPECQNQDCGAALMEATLSHSWIHAARRIILDVWEHNHAALRFYRRYGFEIVGSRAFTVESGAATDSDYIMERCAMD